MEKPRGGIVFQDVLSERSGEHILWSPDSEGSDCLRHGGSPIRRIHEWHLRGDSPCSLKHILGGWCWRSLVPAGFSPRPAPCYADGTAVLTRRPLSRVRFRDVGGWRTARER